MKLLIIIVSKATKYRLNNVNNLNSKELNILLKYKLHAGETKADKPSKFVE